PHARLQDMDLMGIDQVLVIPTKVIAHLPFVADPRGADAFCRAYNDFVLDWCAEAPDRLFPAALLPLQSAQLTVQELQRVANRGFRVALIRPMDARGNYPNDVKPLGSALGLGGIIPMNFGDVFRAFEDTEVVCGIHTFPAHKPPFTVAPGQLASPGELI